MERSVPERSQESAFYQAVIDSLSDGALLIQWARQPFVERLRAKLLVANLHLHLQRFDDSYTRSQEERDLPFFYELATFAELTGRILRPSLQSFDEAHPLRTAVEALEESEQSLAHASRILRESEGINQAFT